MEFGPGCKKKVGSDIQLGRVLLALKETIQKIKL